jgi:serine protease Do
MRSRSRVCAPGRTRVAASATLLALALAARAAAQDEPGLVRVNIVKTFTDNSGPGQTIELNGRSIPNYHPTIIQVFPSTGVVIDDRNHVLAFLGWAWVDVYGGDLRVEIFADPEGKEKLRGKVVGIDQSTGVAVVRPVEGKLKKSALCLQCEIRDGATVVLPSREAQAGQFERAQILGVGVSGRGPSGGWQLTVNRRLDGVGAPLLDTSHRVLGYVANQAVQTAGGRVETLVFPMSQLLTSAGKIIEVGGDICTGWLGVYLDDTRRGERGSSGVKIKSIMAEGPAAKAGLEAEDVIVKWNGAQIDDARQLIRLVQEARVGSPVDLGVVRRGKTVTISAVIGTRKPEANRGSFIVKFPEVMTFPDPSVPAEVTFRNDSVDDRPRIGAVVVQLTPQLAEFLDIRARAGLLVSSVQPSFPAALAGVQAGDVILSIDGIEIREPQAFASHIQSRGWGSTVVLRYLRKKAEHVARIQLKRPSSK